ncbi:MAG: pyridoxal-phosphate dependent enzyme [Deltaproteobacteria bacterium]|nr:pyridoxal-phosphate dependent enzyme [Deltaproteobacteria bacterium]
MVLNSITDCVGNTPLLRLDPQQHGLQHIDLYAKLDHLNPFGSIKDRIAVSMLAPHLAELREKQKTVIEGSSGNTAKSLAALCGMNGLKFRLYTNRVKIPEMRMVLQLMGAELEELPSLSDCPDPMDNNSFFAIADSVARTEPDKYFYTDQIFNPLNLRAHYEQTAKEIHDELGDFDYYINFLGTCGSSLGVIKYAREHFATPLRAWGVVASPGHHVPGGRNMNELWETKFFDKTAFDEFLHGTASDSVDGVVELCRRYGVLGGPTSGLVYKIGLDRLREEDKKLAGTGKRAKAVFIVTDRAEPYMSYIKKYRPDIFSAATTSRPRVEGLAAEEVQGAPTLDAAGLQALLKSETPPLVVDVRGNFAYSIGHIPGSINILDELFGQMIEEGPVFGMERTVVIACSTGIISRKFAAFLSRQGYRAYSVEGGINACKRAGFALSAAPRYASEATGTSGVGDQVALKGMVQI